MSADSSGFFFNVEQFFGSVACQRMSFTEKGVYLVMCFQQWRETQKNLPDDPQAVADLIAVTPAQAAEVAAAWEVVRRKFVTSDHTPGRIWNVKVEKARRQQRAYYKGKALAGKRGGDAKARKHRQRDELEVKQNVAVLESATAHPSGALAKPSDQIRLDKKGLEEKRSDPARAHGLTVFAGALPRDHATHVFCNDTFTVCVPSAVHAKFLGLLAGRFPEREHAHKALLDWYPQVTGPLDAEFVMSDAFKFWQSAFDAAFASKLETGPTNKRIDALMRGGQKALDRMNSR